MFLKKSAHNVSGKITNFNANGGRIFLDLSYILVYHFKF